jgi:hypothetical protein
MADYFPLLSRTIASLGNSTAEQRQIVYQRARVVVQAQLSAIDPPMNEEGIAAELELFEQSVIRLENEMLALEGLKGDGSDDVLKENSTRRHISARLSDLMAKAAAARTAATQERLKSDLPVAADPALAGPAVKVDQVPVPTAGQAASESFIGHDGEGVDHPLAPSSVIEGDPLDALAAAHIRKVAEQQEINQEEGLQDLATGLEPDEKELVAEAASPLGATVSPPDLPTDTEPLPSVEHAEKATDEIVLQTSAAVTNPFSLIPWLPTTPITSETGLPHTEPVISTTEDLPSPLDVDEPGDDRASDDEAAVLSGSDQPVPEMPQISVGLMGTQAELPPAMSEALVSDDPLAHEAGDQASPSFPPFQAVSGTEMDAEAAKAAFWGEAYQPKKDENDEPQSDTENASENAPVDEGANPTLMELTEDESRPRLLQKRRLDRDMVRKIIMVAVFVTVTAAVGITAWILRDQPSDFEQNAGLQRSDLSRKINDRLPSDLAPQNEASKASPQAGQVIGQRVFFLEEVPDGQQPPPPVLGQVSWSLDTIRDSNGAGDVAVKAEVKNLSGSPIFWKLNSPRRKPRKPGRCGISACRKCVWMKPRVGQPCSACRFL